MALPAQRRHAVRSPPAQLRGEIIAIGRHQPAFPGGEVLVAEEREGAHIAKLSHHTPVWRPALRIDESRADGVTGVLDQHEPMPPAQLGDLRHAARIAAIVHDDDGAGAWRDQPFDRYWIDGWLVQSVDV